LEDPRKELNMIKIETTTPTFGPGGNGDLFYAEGGKRTAQAPAWLKKYGLDAYEYEAGNGVSAGEAALREIGDAAKASGILMSIHSPYYISLSGVEEEKRLKSISYIEKTLWAAELLGADTIVIHSGSAAKISRAKAMKLSCDTLAKVAEAVGDNPCARLGIETMGKINQLGTLTEVIEQCKVSPIYTPVVDFGHMNARAIGGEFSDVDSYRRVFNEIAEKLGDQHAMHLHCHFSKIEYTVGGEKRHLTFEDAVYGPDFAPLAEVLYKRGAEPIIICESAGTQSKDALEMQNLYIRASQGK
jgi:deoxyribonuclease-4